MSARRRRHTVAEKRKHGRKAAKVKRPSRARKLDPETGFRYGTIGDRVVQAILRSTAERSGLNEEKARKEIRDIVRRERRKKRKDLSARAVNDAARTWRWLAARSLRAVAKMAARRAKKEQAATKTVAVGTPVVGAV